MIEESLGMATRKRKRKEKISVFFTSQKIFICVGKKFLEDEKKNKFEVGMNMKASFDDVRKLIFYPLNFEYFNRKKYSNPF